MMEEDKFFRCLGCGATITELGSTFTMRDFFAGCALVANTVHKIYGSGVTAENRIASDAYILADAMMKERGD